MATRMPSDKLAMALEAGWGDAEHALFATDLRGCVLYANRAFEQLVGFAADALRGSSPPYPFWHPEKAPVLAATLKFVANGEWEALRTHSLEASFHHRDGRAIDVVIAGGPLRHGGELAGYGGFVIQLDRGSPGEFSGAVAVCSALRRLQATLAPPPPGPDGAPVGPPAATPREREVLDLLLKGLRVASIGRRLGVSPSTVRNHLKSLFRKARVHSQAELIERYRPVDSGRPLREACR